jgi:hypothetical protein
MAFAISIIKKEEPISIGSSFTNISCGIGLICILLYPFKTFGQARTIKIYPTAGITWRSTAMNFFNFNAVIPADPTIPYDYERNVQGFSINPGLQIEVFNIGFEYYPNLRYDVVHGVIGVENERIREFIIDHNFNLILKRKIDFGIGLTIVNAGKGYEFVNPIPRYHNIEFKTYNTFVTIPVKKVINLEIKALYIPKDFPVNPNEQYIMYGLRVYYKFDFLNKKVKHVQFAN